MKKTDTKFLSGILLKSFLFSILFYFLIGFNFQDSKTGGWIQQFLPSLPGNPPINDITFTDSLTGYATTYGPGGNDTDYVIKTTNGGNNWLIIRTEPGPYNGFDKLFFLNKDTGYIASYVGISTNISNLQKTTNGGLNWISLYWPTSGEPSDLFVLNTDTIWMCSPSNFGGGLYRTTNGGLNWQVQYNVSGSGNPNKIYMYNARIGFISAGGAFYKTTNSGVNWTGITGENDYTDIYFIDSLVGYKAKTEIKKTTNGGLNWQAQYLPNVIGALITYREINKFAYINDTMYGVYGTVRYPNLQVRGIVYKTFNGGLNWGYQIPDTTLIRFPLYNYTKFITSKKGWCYLDNGIFTNTGGDSTIFTGISNINNYISEKFTLNQNYPNPFNSTTLIGYYIQEPGWVKIKIYDIKGKEMGTLVNEVQGVGGYGVPVSVELSSGVYFYKMILTTKNGIQMDTKKMVVVK
jgi:photosystem II stability/assembly factor-like uncharacterized protein